MESGTGTAKKERIVSIDALRGFDMFWIIGGGEVFSALFKMFDNPVSRALANQLEHASWTGFRFEDLIFPLFLFLAGASMPFSLTRRLDRGDSRRDLYMHIIQRTLTIYILGLIYYDLFDFNLSQLRYGGVLQRIALCYFFTALIVMNTKIRGQAMWTGITLIVYWAVLKFVPVPGYGAGNFTTDGNLGVYLDQNFLPGRHYTYGDYKLGDATGIIGTFPAIASTLLGVLSGHWVKSGFSRNRIVLGLITAGIACLILSLIWSLSVPINKFLWTSPYVLFAGGWSLLLFALFYWIIDVRGYKRWAFPFVVIGMNPITIYVVARVLNFGDIADIFVHGFIDSIGSFRPFFRACCVLGVKWLFLYFLYRRKIFLKA